MNSNGAAPLLSQIGKKKSTTTSSGESSDSIKVICRFRPPRLKAGDGKPSSNGIDSFKLDGKTSEIEYVSDFYDSKIFKFDRVSNDSFYHNFKLLTII